MQGRRRTWSHPERPPTSSLHPTRRSSPVRQPAADQRLCVSDPARLSIALEAPTLFARLLAGSVTFILFTYAFVNMAWSRFCRGVGVPLPFVTDGGTPCDAGMGLGI